MTQFTGYSQAGQDRLAFNLLVEPRNRHDGTFLDIGCCHPTERNNTYALEQLGWRGWLVDGDANAVELCRTVRQSPVYCGDAETFDFAGLFEPDAERHVDYISLDVDQASLGALRGVLRAGLVCSLMTIEHDLYRFGPEPRRCMRELLEQAGYDRLCGDVCDQELPFEDWWVRPDRVDMAAAERYRSEGWDWRKILG